MYRFLLTRAISLVFVLLCVTFITFIIGYFAPGDPICALMGIKCISSPSTHRELLHIYGLDLPWWQQYYNFVAHALHGQFGLSYHYQQRDAIDVLKGGFPISLELGLEVLAVTTIIGIPFGVYSALRAGTQMDTVLTTTSIILYTVPDLVFIVGFQVLMVWLYQQSLPYLPVAGWDTWQARIGPVLIAATTGFGYISRLTRTTMLEVLKQDYVRTARAKGLRERVVIYLHVLRNASIPLITLIGPSLAFLVTGIFIIEYAFNIPGIAYQTLAAVSERDYPVVQASTIIFSTAVVCFNALTDVIYAIADPRIRLQ
jgi:ABC-type dipeptide/oligopeptide/nickel transport system permease component